MAEQRGKAAVLPDTVLVKEGCKPRKEWKPEHWAAFLQGWTRQRLGTLLAISARYPTHEEYFNVGFLEARRFEEVRT